MDTMSIPAGDVLRLMVSRFGLPAVIEELAAVAADLHPEDDSWHEASVALRLVAEEAAGTSVAF